MLGSRTESALGEERSPRAARALASFCSLACASGLAALCVTTGCSAVTALSETRRAERALISTQGLRNTPGAAYSLTMGRAYLEKAREEAAEAHYGNAVAYAQAARRAADEAQRTQVQRVTARLAPTAKTSSREAAAPIAPREATR